VIRLPQNTLDIFCILALSPNAHDRIVPCALQLKWTDYHHVGTQQPQCLAALLYRLGFEAELQGSPKFPGSHVLEAALCDGYVAITRVGFLLHLSRNF
jgi:hypothetical protein